ncbi:hypothetical protein ACIHCQ_44280 [Streptomyces sp. NPDC052236]|uniref:hypothetical protein n=1 Tax=Streptomyces sp. NPDC052236 TaxID=3365686 RepID=UPI0037CE6B9C
MFGAGNGNRKWRRAVVGAVVLSTLAACGGSDGDGGGKGGKPSAAASAAGPKALTEAELTALSFTEGEKIGPYEASDLGAPRSEDYTADPAVCQPLVSLAKGVTDLDPAAEVHREVDVADEMNGTSVSVQLRSYANGRAAAVMKALAAAGTRCAGGFTEDRALAQAKYLKVEPVKAPAFAADADEAQAYRFTIRDVGDGKLKLYEYLTLVRSGSVTLSFRADIISTKDIGGVPEEVMRAQWEKFRANQKGTPESGE